jgi:hypothetical protein
MCPKFFFKKNYQFRELPLIAWDELRGVSYCRFELKFMLCKT